MTDREKTIQHLEMVKEEIRTSKYDTWFSGTKKVRFMGYVDDAIELLKEQEPRVMAIEEVKHAEAGSVVWIEWRHDGKINSAILFRLINKGIDDSLEFHVLDGFVAARLACYGTKWRCWTSGPMDEQREAVKWDD